MMIFNHYYYHHYYCYHYLLSSSTSPSSSSFFFYSNRYDNSSDQPILKVPKSKLIPFHGHKKEALKINAADDDYDVNRSSSCRRRRHDNDLLKWNEDLMMKLKNVMLL